MNTLLCKVHVWVNLLWKKTCFLNAFESSTFLVVFISSKCEMWGSKFMSSHQLEFDVKCHGFIHWVTVLNALGAMLSRRIFWWFQSSRNHMSSEYWWMHVDAPRSPAKNIDCPSHVTNIALSILVLPSHHIMQPWLINFVVCLCVFLGCDFLVWHVREGLPLCGGIGCSCAALGKCLWRTWGFYVAYTNTYLYLTWGLLAYHNPTDTDFRHLKVARVLDKDLSDCLMEGFV